MNRRSFFKKLAVGAVVVAVTPTVLADIATKPQTYSTYVMGSDAVLNIETIREMKRQLVSSEVMPFGKNQFAGIVHPYVYADLKGLS